MRIKQPAPRSQPHRVGQGPEGRIRQQYLVARRSDWTHEYGVGAMWMSLARQWKMPIRELKRICKPHLFA